MTKVKTTIPMHRGGFAKAEFVPAYQASKGALFAVHRVPGSQAWTVALAHAPGPCGGLVPAGYPMRLEPLLALVAFVEAKCPAEVETWRSIDGSAMSKGLDPRQAEAGRRMRYFAAIYANELANA